MAKRRFNLFMDEELYTNVKKYADDNGISVAGAISVLSNYALDTLNAMKMTTELTKNPQFMEFLKTSTVINQEKE